MRSTTTTTVGRLIAASALLIGCGDDGGGAMPLDGGADARMPDGGPGDDGAAPVDGGPDAADDAAMGAGDGGAGDCERDRLLLTSARFGPEPDGRLLVFDPDEGDFRQTSEANEDTDSFADRAGCTPLVLERTLGNVRVQSSEDPLVTDHVIDVDPEDSAPDDEFASNPQRVVSVSENKAYVIALSLNDILIVDPTASGDEAITGRIDLSPLVLEGDPDGRVEPSDAIRIGDRLYVALGNYYFLDVAQVFVGSAVAVIDTTTDELVDVDPETAEMDAIELEGDNPVAGLAHDAENDRLVVGSKGAHGMVDDGIEAIDLESHEPTGVLLSEEEAGQDIASFAWLDAARAYVRLNAEYDSETFELIRPAEVRAWDPSGDLEEDPLVEGADGMLLHDGTLYVWSYEDEAERAQLRTFDAASGAETTPESGPHELGELPLFSAVASP